MRILVLGGTAFLGHAIAAEAVARDHQVVCAARGVSGASPAGARLVAWDRASAPPAHLAELDPDAVVDVARLPSYVRRAVGVWAKAHWTFVSTANVYADRSAPGGTTTSPLVDPVDDDLDPMSAPEVYGGMKVACERIVREGTRASLVLRPGLIVGPQDPSGRFAYWPSHAAAALADGGPLLMPGTPQDLVQMVDVRDLASWVLDSIELRRSGTFDAVAPAITRAAFLTGLARGAGGTLTPQWIADERLVAAGVQAWTGPGSIPLWIDEPASEGFMARDVAASLGAGLSPRDLTETVRDTLAWLRAAPGAAVTGLTRAEELHLLDVLG